MLSKALHYAFILSGLALTSLGVKFGLKDEAECTGSRLSGLLH